MNRISSFQNDREYQSALIEVSALVDNEPTLASEEAIKFESLLKSIESYESENYPI